MKLNKIFSMFAATAVVFGLTACADTDAQYSIPEIDTAQLVSTSVNNGAAKIKRGDITVKVAYDKPVFMSSEKAKEQIQVTGATLVSAHVLGASNEVTIVVNCPTRETPVTISYPDGLVLNSQGKPAPGTTVNFTTVNIPTAPVAATSANATKLYTYLRNNFETKILTGMMAPSNGWSTEEADKVYGWTGHYPAIAGFDYLHLLSSAEGAWINYGDITPVKNWADNGGIVTIGWHWNVPMFAPVSESIDETVWEGTLNVGGWEQVIQLTADQFANAKAGQSIIVKVEQDATQGWWQGSLKNASWSDLADGAGVIEMASGAISYSFPINDDVLAEIQANGLIVGGCNHTIKSINLGTAGTIYASTDYSFYKTVTEGEGNDAVTRTNEFDPAEAVVDGTWENDVVKADLAKLASYLKLLQQQDIPVLWRPFHEAAGQWFWWGKDAESYKALWIYTFNYLKAEGLNNLIWVWTSEVGDDDWYPGDEYVDIIGRDIYGKDAETCAKDYATLSDTYGDHIIALTECGFSTNGEDTTEIADPTEQWEAGATWGWFMPWYSADEHAPQSWWEKFLNDSRIVWRDGVNF